MNNRSWSTNEAERLDSGEDEGVEMADEAGEVVVGEAGEVRKEGGEGHVEAAGRDNGLC